MEPGLLPLVQVTPPLLGSDNLGQTPLGVMLFVVVGLTLEEEEDELLPVCPPTGTQLPSCSVHEPDEQNVINWPLRANPK